MADHSKFSDEFLSHLRRKTANLIDKEIHLAAETKCIFIWLKLGSTCKMYFYWVNLGSTCKT